jgi:hypothetical protein
LTTTLFPRAHLVTAWPFDLDDLGACFGEYQRREWARQKRGEIEDQAFF